MSYNAATGLVYFPTIHQAHLFTDKGVKIDTWTSPDWHANAPTEGFGVDAEQLVGKPFGSLRAWNPVTLTRV